MLWSAVELVASLGLPVEPFKVEGPSTTLTFLGIEIKTVSRELCLPRGKLLCLKEVLEEESYTEDVCDKASTPCSCGAPLRCSTSHPAGRPFIRQLIDAKSEMKKASHFTRINPGCKADILVVCVHGGLEWHRLILHQNLGTINNC